MKRAVTDARPFEIGFKGSGAFPNLNYIKVLWVGLVNSDPLSGISRFLDDEMATLGFKRDGRDFSPHVTIGRLKGSQGKEIIQDLLSKTKTADFGSQTVDRLRLKKSVLETSGPTYTTIAEAPFPTV
jgi:2'-5' RNA ligase